MMSSLANYTIAHIPRGSTNTVMAVGEMFICSKTGAKLFADGGQEKEYKCIFVPR